jgi:hypothetical protein
VHEKVKPFVCDCGRAFGFKKVLQRHELTHTQPAPPRERKVRKTRIIDAIAGIAGDELARNIVCLVEGCDRRFLRDYDLRRHVASVHKGEQGTTEEREVTYVGIEIVEKDFEMQDVAQVTTPARDSFPLTDIHGTI